MGDAELAQNLFMRDAFAASEGRAGLVELSGRFGCDVFVFEGGQRERARKRIHHNFEQTADCIQFLGRKEIE
jgi:hypothetical protein